MKLKSNIGIVAYGVYLPSSSISGEEIATAQGKKNSGVPQSIGVESKTVPSRDEDTITMSTAAADQALDRWQGKKLSIGALFIGSESHPYAVKPSGTVVQQALGLSNSMALADLEFACKAGTQALQINCLYVAAGFTVAALAIGADTAQSKPGDTLEFTAGAGASALIVGKKNILVKVLATNSYVTDTPDFWRKAGQQYPQHAGRFSGEPAYFNHVASATRQLLKETKLKPSDIDYCVFHTPNAKFPKLVAQQLGFSQQQLEPSLVVRKIGNTYAAASLLGLSAVLDQAKAKQKILLTSYGSGAGADSFLLETTPLLVSQRKKWHNSVADQISSLKPVSYQDYRKNTQGVN